MVCRKIEILIEVLKKIGKWREISHAVHEVFKKSITVYLNKRWNVTSLWTHIFKWTMDQHN